jgi:hypothetical protein
MTGRLVDMPNKSLLTALPLVAALLVRDQVSWLKWGIVNYIALLRVNLTFTRVLATCCFP